MKRKSGGKAVFIAKLWGLVLLNWLLGMNEQLSGDELFYSLPMARYTNQEN